jgi:hypothetical protein
MAEQGFVGLAIFLGLLGSCIFSARRLRKRAGKNPALLWIGNYSQAVEVGILAYMVSGAFLGRAYFDLYFQLVAILIILKVLYRKEIRTVAIVQEKAVVMSEPELQEVAY